MRKYPPWLIGFGLLALAGIVRFQGLLKYNLEWDEVHILAIAMEPLADIIRLGAFLDHHPPGMALLEHGWITLFGDSDVAVRSLTWFLGMLGLWGSYLLARQLTNSTQVALLAAGLGVCSVMLWHYAQITTFYSGHYAAVMLSWYFLLRLIDLPNWRRLGLWLVTTLVAMVLHSGGAVFLVGQIVYLIWIRRLLSASAKKILITSGVALLILYSPYLWLLAQPWHMSRVFSYPFATFLSVVTIPGNITLLGYEWRNAHLFPPVPVMLLGAAAIYALLFLGFRAAKQNFPQALPAAVCLGLVPMVALYAASLVLQLGVLQLRVILYAVFSIHLLLAIWMSRQKHGFLLLALFIAIQVWNPWQFRPGEDTGRFLAEQTRAAGFRPGDGVVFYPGWMSLVFLRYFDPPAFGLGAQERAIDPQTENYFKMVNRIDERYFFVSDRSVLYRPDVLAQFAVFQRQHPRMWILADPFSDLAPILCLTAADTTYYVWSPDLAFEEGHCAYEKR